MITRQQLNECLAIQKKTGERLGRILKNKGYVTERQLMEIMEFQLGIPFVNLDAINLSHMLSKHIPATLARKPKWCRSGGGKKLFLAMDDPVDFIAGGRARGFRPGYLPDAVHRARHRNRHHQDLRQQYAETAIKN